MNVIEAVNLLIEGERIKRKDWDDGTYLCMSDGHSWRIRSWIEKRRIRYDDIEDDDDDDIEDDDDDDIEDPKKNYWLENDNFEFSKSDVLYQNWEIYKENNNE